MPSTSFFALCIPELLYTTHKDRVKERIYFSIKTISWSAVVAWAVTILSLSSISGDNLDPYMLKVPSWDKVCHLIAFSAGGMLMAFALRRTTRLRWSWIVALSIVSISLFGAIDEWHQLYTPRRSGADVGDWVFDTVGAAIGAVTIYFIYGRFRSSTSARPCCEAAARD